MRNALHALTDELRRLKTAGVKSVSVSDETVAALRRAVAARAGGAGGTKGASEAAGPAPALAVTPAAAAAPLVPEAPRATPSAATRPAVSVPVTEAPKLPPAPVVTLPLGDKKTRWEALLGLVVNDPHCRANVRAGKKVVLGVGSLDARIMFVGEAPGAEEEIQGEPFVGPAGQLLTKMIQAMGLKRSDVYIGNIMNWRPQMPTAEGREQVGNRPPTEDEMRYCLPYLRAQIDVVQPELLVALGSTAAQGLLGFGSFKALGDIRGKWHAFADKPLMVTYHPSYILRNQSNRSKRMIWEDLLKVMERAALPVSDKQRGFFLEK
jgi:uracil-DNA glycosylase family 4